jgi:hypothetical protein
MTHFTGCQPIEEHHSLGRVLQKPTQEAWDLALEVASKDKVRWAIDGIFPADDVFGNFCCYAVNTNVCFRGYVNVAFFTVVRKT